MKRATYIIWCMNSDMENCGTLLTRRSLRYFSTRFIWKEIIWLIHSWIDVNNSRSRKKVCVPWVTIKLDMNWMNTHHKIYSKIYIILSWHMNFYLNLLYTDLQTWVFHRIIVLWIGIKKTIIIIVIMFTFSFFHGLMMFTEGDLLW